MKNISMSSTASCCTNLQTDCSTAAIIACLILKWTPLSGHFIFAKRTISHGFISGEHGRLARWRKWRACDVGEAKEEKVLWCMCSSFSNLSVTSPTSQLILQPLRRFTYVTAHSPTLPLLHPRHSSFSSTFIASPTSQFILQPFFRFSYVTRSSLTSPGEPSMPGSWEDALEFLSSICEVN